MVGKFAAAFAGWHLKIFVRVADRFEQQTLLRITGHNRRAGIAAFQQSVAGVKQQAPFDFFRVLRVTLVAMLDEDRTDFLLKELDAGAVGFGGSRGCNNASEQQTCCPNKSCLADSFLHERS